MPSHITLHTPASTANLGPGFDCLGLALALYNTIEADVVDDVTTQIEIEGEGVDQLPHDERNLISRAAHTLWQHVGRQPLALRIKSINDIPLGSGLGSSAAATIGGLSLANALLDHPLAKSDLLQLAYQIEGHADNATAALLGGLTIVSAHADELLYTHIDAPALAVVIALPDIALATHDARGVLPQQVRLSDAIFNMGSALLVVQALQAGDYKMLAQTMQDRLHQPYRRMLIRGYDDVERAAIDSGAAAVVLSGAGPSLAAFTDHGHTQIAQAMRDAFAAHRIDCRTFVLPVDQYGVRVETTLT